MKAGSILLRDLIYSQQFNLSLAAVKRKILSVIIYITQAGKYMLQIVGSLTAIGEIGVSFEYSII